MRYTLAPFFAAGLLALVVYPSCASAATPAIGSPADPPIIAADEKKPADSQPDDKKSEEKKEDKKPETKPGHPKPYKEVITADAQSESGLFMVHRIDEKVYYEIPPAVLGREMLWTTEIARTAAGTGWGGVPVGDRIVRWTRHANKVYLRLVSYRLRGDGKSAIQRAVDSASFEPIVMAFNVEAEGKEKAPVIEVTKLLTTDVPEFSAKDRLGAAGVDSDRSYVDQVKSFPANIEVRSILTYTPKPPTQGVPGPFGGSRPATTAMIHYSMDLLPEKPMQGRYYDSRIGYFTESFDDYAADDNRVVPREYIARYRLEKKDPAAALSEPVHPIVYFISREVPEKWRPYIKQGVEDWREAFETAGFRNAIVCKEAPTEEEDPNWDPEDARYSVIRWAANPIENAMGPHVHDPRSGEILSAHIIVWHDALKLIEDMYFVQCAPLDLRTRHLPLPESLMGEMLRYVVAHEVGHTLGLRHNHKASSSYTVAQLRDRAFTEKYGDEASIMAYGRFNYVAQPGDQARLIPKIGPYDRFAIEWGYTPLPNAAQGAPGPEQEKPALDRIAARQITDPILRFGGEDRPAQSDPTVQTEDLGSDPVAATSYGLKNLALVSAMLLPSATKFGEDYQRLGEMYDFLLTQRLWELGHVAKLVGGVEETRYHAGRGGTTFNPVSRERQAQAVRFLLQHAFHTPQWAVPVEVLRRIEPEGVTSRVLSGQSYLLSSLLGEDRVRRLMDNEALSPDSAYTVQELVGDLQHGIWEELALSRPVVDPYRRDLQRAYLRIMKGKLVGDGGAQSEMRPVARGALAELQHSLEGAIRRTQDRPTLLHLQSCRVEIERALHPVLPTEPAAAIPAPAFLKPAPDF